MAWKLKKKAKSLLEQEEGTVFKPRGGKTTFALIYPNRYWVGMSSLGFQTVYSLLNQHPSLLCERAFLPDKEDLKALYRSRYQIFSLESQQPLREFEILGFSISYEEDFLNVLKILDLAKIPLKREDRNDSDPLIIAGGITCFLNPEPLADFIDLFIVGEAEEVMPELVQTYKSYSGSGLHRGELISRLGRLEGVYAPGNYRASYYDDGPISGFEALNGAPVKIKRRLIKKLETNPAHSRISTPATELGGMFLVELGRGCPWRCRFCANSYVYLPPRNYPAERVKEVIPEDRKVKVGLISSQFSGSPGLEEVMSSIIARGSNVSAPSLRLDLLSEETLLYLKKSGHKTISLAPETGSETLRKVINKGFTDEQILKTVEKIIKNDIFNLKLYFMIGLPGETSRDIDAIVALAGMIKSQILKYGRSRRLGTLTLSINPFIPKASTPFQWHGLEDILSLREKLEIIKKRLKGEGNVVVKSESLRSSYLQVLLSRGDRRAGEILLAAHQHGWRSALREAEPQPDFYVYRQIEHSEILPWDFIDHGIEKEYLSEEYRRGMKGLLSPPCAPGDCSRCGVCSWSSVEKEQVI
ncbi:MAG: radical SAM protein [Deltaproteobacteria bacterium]|nr:MAG: radical SAM protein [Deltaproteobacteria bacterium]